MGNGINYELDFEKLISDMEDRKLLEFVARQMLEVTGKVKTLNTKMTTIETGDRKASGIIGGISGTITSIIVSLINYFGVNRG